MDKARTALDGVTRQKTQHRAHIVHRRRSFLAILTTIVIVVGGFLYYNQQKDTIVLRIGSGPFNSDSHELMEQVADVVNRHTDELAVEVVATRDSSMNISILNEGEVDLATIRSDTPVVSNVRQVANLFPDYFQIITRSDRSIFRVVDLVGKKIAIPRFGTDEFRSFWIIGDHYDLPISGVKWWSMSFEDAAEKLLSEEVDAIFTVRSLRDRRLLNLFEDAGLKNTSLRFVPVDQAEAISIKRPFLQAKVIPKGGFLGNSPTPSRDMITSTVDRVLVAREDVDTEAIRLLTQILFEHRLDLTIRFSLASAITTPDTEAGLSIPLHEGSAQYFDRDEPSFLHEHAEPLALLVTVTAMLISSLVALRSQFVSSQKNRMDSYNYRLLDIAEAARNASSRTAIRELKNELASVLEEVVRALDQDAITDEGFQSFSLLWESVREILNDQMTDMNGISSEGKQNPTHGTYEENKNHVPSQH